MALTTKRPPRLAIDWANENIQEEDVVRKFFDDYYSNKIGKEFKVWVLDNLDTMTMILEEMKRSKESEKKT